MRYVGKNRRNRKCKGSEVHVYLIHSRKEGRLLQDNTKWQMMPLLVRELEWKAQWIQHQRLGLRSWVGLPPLPGLRLWSKAEDKEWIPVTKLGRLVKDMKIKCLEEICLFSLPIKESEIIDFFPLGYPSRMRF